jgi:hypothetical protein
VHEHGFQRVDRLFAVGVPYANQYASMAPLFEHYGIALWMPEVGGRVDWHAEDHEQTMLALGLSSSGRSPGQGSGSGPRWPPRPESKAGTWAGVRPTGTGSVMRARTRTRRDVRARHHLQGCIVADAGRQCRAQLSGLRA